MTFRALLDDVEAKTGLSPDEFIQIIDQSGMEKTDIHAVSSWLQVEYSLPVSHADALAQVISDGILISDKQVGSAGSHRDEVRSEDNEMMGA